MMLLCDARRQRFVGDVNGSWDNLCIWKIMEKEGLESVVLNSVFHSIWMMVVDYYITWT